ncbi:hypothetical protein Gotur_034250 [Gossypium turneri]
MGDINKRIDDVDDRLIDGLQMMKEQSRDFVTMCLTSNKDCVQGLLDSQRKRLTERNDALEAMVMALKEEIIATTIALSTKIE